MPVQLPTTNSEDRPVIPMTEEQKYTLDSQGWMLLPGILDAAEIAEVRDHMERWAAAPNALPEEERWYAGGAAQKLIDHPAILSVLYESLATPHYGSETAYPFRCEGGFGTIRKAGHDNWSPHGGGGYFNMQSNSHHYKFLPGKMNTGLTRVVWELTDVTAGEGGTAFLSGSHKAAFPLPPEVKADRQHRLWSRYSCPAGSAVVFTEALTHTGDLWTNTDHPRMAIFQCYNGIGERFHGNAPPQKVIASMPPKRRSLFREVWTWTGGANYNNKVDDSRYV